MNPLISCLRSHFARTSQQLMQQTYESILDLIEHLSGV